jgi:CheY-like chemotaxis protein
MELLEIDEFYNSLYRSYFTIETILKFNLTFFMENVVQCLLIDDDKEDQEFFMMALEILDPKIIGLTINGCVDAIETLTTDPSLVPDFIFLDMNMPKLSGIDCLSEIQKLPHLLNTRVIILSSNLNEIHMGICKELGATAYLVKAATLNELVETLTGVMTSKN